MKLKNYSNQLILFMKEKHMFFQRKNVINVKIKILQQYFVKILMNHYVLIVFIKIILILKILEE